MTSTLPSSWRLCVSVLVLSASLPAGLPANVLWADSEDASAPAHLESTVLALGQNLTVTLRSQAIGSLAAIYFSATPGAFAIPGSPHSPVIRIGFPIYPSAIGTIDASGRLQAGGLVPPTVPIGREFHLQGFVRSAPHQVWFGSEPLVLTNAQPSVFFSDDTISLDPAAALHSATDVDWADVDRDGFQDVLVANDGNGAQMLVLMNQNGTLVDEAAARLPGAALVPATCLETADVDGDGRIDLFLGTSEDATSPAPNLLLHNGPGGVFTLVPGFPAGSGLALDAEFGDIDGDRDIDLVLANQPDPLHPGEIPDGIVLYVNQGGLQGGVRGQFQADALFGTLPGNDTHADGGDVSLGDLDNDGDLDLFVARTGGANGAQNQLFVNDGVGGYAEVTSTALPVILDNSFEADFADFDGDGWLDVFVANSVSAVPTGAHLLMNQGPIGPGGTPVFADASVDVPASLGPTTRVRISLDIGDVDQDGDPDVAIGIHEVPAGPPPVTAGKAVLLLNQGGNQGGTPATFAVDASFDAFALMVCADVAFGDLDVDGDLDLYIANSGRLFVTDFQDRLLINEY